MNLPSWMPQYGLMTTLIVGLLLVLLTCALVQWLWNGLVSDLFTLRRISLWESFKILLLSLILFGGAALSFNFNISETTTTADGTKTVTYGIGSGKK
ncbi:MAG: hypothetical protein ABIO94_00940 [Opitutaceae bacterium]